MTDTPIAPPKPVKKAKKRRAKRVARAPREASTPIVREVFPGLTVADCCKTCNADGCVISGSNYCAHPRKGALQGRDMHDVAAVGRLNAARKSLAAADADKRFS